MDFKVLAVFFYFFALITLGVIASRRTKDLRDYFAGGKRMGFLSVAFSSRATGESAWLLIGLTGFGAAFGLKGLWIVLGEMLGVGLAWLWLSRPFKRLTDRYDSITIPDYLESRFGDTGHWLRLIAAGTLAIFVPVYVSAQIHASGVAFEQFLHWDYFVGAAVGFGVVMVYITTGGFIAVVWSDVFQGSLMLLGLVALPLIGLAYMDVPVLESLRENYPGHLSLIGAGNLTTMRVVELVGLVAIGIGFLGSPQVFVRFIALKSENEIKRGAAVALLWTLLADTSAVLAGIVGRAALTGDLGASSEDVLPMMVNTMLHPFVAGLYIACVLSAIMSTVDSLLVVASSAVVRDYYQKTRSKTLNEKSMVRLCRGVTISLALIAFALAMGLALFTPLRSEGLFWFIIFGWSGIAATFCPTIILSLTWPRMTALGAKVGMVSGFLSVPIFKFGVTKIPVVGEYFDNLDVLAPSFAVSALFIVVVSLLDKSGQKRIAIAQSDLSWAHAHDPESEDEPSTPEA